MKLFFLGQLAVTYAGLADFFDDVSYQAEDAWLEEISKSSEERWHKNECQEYLLPDVPGGYWKCKGSKKCALYCHNAPGVHSSVKCKSATWKGGKGAKCPVKKPECKCEDAKKPKVEHGWWDCFTNKDGDYVCDLICDAEENGGSPPQTPTGKKVQITCDPVNERWWCNDVDPHCPAPDLHCPEDKLIDVPGGKWNCNKKTGHCSLNCNGDVQECAATCNRKKCQWEYAGEPKCKDPCTKKKKKMCLDSCGAYHPYCCDPDPGCVCEKYPQNNECISTCKDCPRPGDGTGRFECKIAFVEGEKTCDKKGRCTQKPGQKRYVCQFNCQGKFSGKMIVCKDEKWWGNVEHDKFTCQPKCTGLNAVDNGKWECKDRFNEGTRQTIKNADCKLVCDAGYEPKNSVTTAKCNPETGDYTHNCQAKCVKSCEAKGMSPCEHGKGCCPRPCGPPCDKQKKPKVAGAWWECMIDENCKETCLLKCLNGIIPTNKHGYHVSIKCDKARWWANDPCIADLCKAPVEPVKCNKSKLPNVPYGDWDCTDGQKSSSNPGTICKLECDHGDIVHHAYECSPDGDWFEKYGQGECSCSSCNPKKQCCSWQHGNPNKKDGNYNELCEECKPSCPKEKCDKADLPEIQGSGRWHCGMVKGKDGHPEYACVLMCGKNKTQTVMACRANGKGVCKWRGNANGVCKCHEECSMGDLPNVEHGDWDNCLYIDAPPFSTKICHLECNGKVMTSCEAKCEQGPGKKGNWQIESSIKKDHCSNVNKPIQDPCKDGCLKCNDAPVPSIDNGKWNCKKKHCDLECDDGYKVIDGKCSLKCENGKGWKTIGNPKCVAIDDGGDGGDDGPICVEPNHIPVKNGWMECKNKKGAKGKQDCMLMCDKDHTPEFCTEYKELFATYDCKTGYFNPKGPKGKKSKWSCVKGKCDKKFKETCWAGP